MNFTIKTGVTQIKATSVTITHSESRLPEITFTIPVENIPQEIESVSLFYNQKKISSGQIIAQRIANDICEYQITHTTTQYQDLNPLTQHHATPIEVINFNLLDSSPYFSKLLSDQKRTTITQSGVIKISLTPNIKVKKIKSISVKINANWAYSNTKYINLGHSIAQVVNSQTNIPNSHPPPTFPLTSPFCFFDAISEKISHSLPKEMQLISNNTQLVDVFYNKLSHNVWCMGGYISSDIAIVHSAKREIQEIASFQISSPHFCKDGEDIEFNFNAPQFDSSVDPWKPYANYSKSEVVIFDNQIYEALETHNSSVFEESFWKKTRAIENPDSFYFTKHTEILENAMSYVGAFIFKETRAIEIKVTVTTSKIFDSNLNVGDQVCINVNNIEYQGNISKIAIICSGIQNEATVSILCSFIKNISGSYNGIHFSMPQFKPFLRNNDFPKISFTSSFEKETLSVQIPIPEIITRNFFCIDAEWRPNEI